MHEPTSPILDFYPRDFIVDSEGKRAEWEGVVLISFVDVPRLAKAAASIDPARLTPEERARNQLGSILTFTHDSGVRSSLTLDRCLSLCLFCLLQKGELVSA